MNTRSCPRCGTHTTARPLRVINCKCGYTGFRWHFPIIDAPPERPGRTWTVEQRDEQRRKILAYRERAVLTGGLYPSMSHLEKDEERMKGWRSTLGPEKPRITE